MPSENLGMGMAGGPKLWREHVLVPGHLWKYEDIRRNPAAGLAATLEFLGIPIHAPTISELVDFA
jgi:hypothetical protein